MDMTLGAVDLILEASLLANRSWGLCGGKSQTTAMVGVGRFCSTGWHEVLIHADSRCAALWLDHRLNHYDLKCWAMRCKLVAAPIDAEEPVRLAGSCTAFEIPSLPSVILGPAIRGRRRSALLATAGRG